MSNNKLSMKLYTEEQILKFLEDKIIFDSDDLEELIPIELPSDFEIWKEGHEEMNIGSHNAFSRGAKWMRDKIQGGNK